MNSRRTFVKQIGLSTAGLMVAPSLFSWTMAAPSNGSLPRSTPEMQGVSSDVLSNLFDAMDASDIEFHSVMVLRNGFVIGEGWWAPYAPQYRHTLHSLSKSFTSAAVGLAINKGHFTIESQVISFFPDMLPKEVSPNLAAMKVKHLLTMTTGHQTSKGIMTNSAPWVQAFLAAPIVHEPGTYYVYNTAASYMLSAIVQKTTGKTLLEFLKPRLMEPLHIEGADWETSPQGINTGGFGLRVRTEDIAKFSQLYLNKGKWNGKQIIPAAWVEASGKEQWTFTSNPFGGKSPKEHDDWQQGYGYQFWRTQHNGFRSDGLYGQFGIILPDQQTVVAITEQSFNTQKTLNFVWDVLFPGLQKTTLSTNKAAQQKLKNKEASLQVKFAPMATKSTMTAAVSSKKFILESNPFDAKAITFNFNKDTCEMTVHYDQGDRKLSFGINRWEKNKNGIFLNAQLPFPVNSLPNVASPIACNATWKDDNTLYLEIRPVETVTSDSITCRFTDYSVKLTFLQSVAKAGKEQEKRPVIVGRLA
jgi:CubicO group peptidase (beta-lactamase class C family)